jgi:hypothetical protein
MIALGIYNPSGYAAKTRPILAIEFPEGVSNLLLSAKPFLHGARGKQLTDDISMPFDKLFYAFIADLRRMGLINHQMMEGGIILLNRLVAQATVHFFLIYWYSENFPVNSFSTAVSPNMTMP